MAKNGVGSKRRRIGFTIFFLKFSLYQNDVVLDKTASKRRRLGAAFKYPKWRRFEYLTAASKRRHFGQVLAETTSFWLLLKKKKEKGNDVVLSLEETKQRRFIWSSPPNRNPLFWSSSLQQFGGGGGGVERVGGRRPVVVSESSLLTVVAAAAGDEPFGPTTDCGKDEQRWRRRRRRCDLLQMCWLSLLISSGIQTNYCRSGNRFHFFSIYKIFLFPLGVQKPFTGRRFLSIASLYFPCQFEYLVQYLLVHGLDFLLPMAIMLRVGLVFGKFC